MSTAADIAQQIARAIADEVAGEAYGTSAYNQVIGAARRAVLPTVTDLLTARAEIARLTGELARETAARGEAEGRAGAWERAAKVAAGVAGEANGRAGKLHALLDEATALIDDFQSAGHGDGHDSADLIAIKDHQERGARWLAPLLTAGGDLRSAEELAALQPPRAPGGEEPHA